jgi:hypothetical protein
MNSGLVNYLSKSIVQLLEYRDDEIKKLTTFLINLGYTQCVLCKDYHLRTYPCPECGKLYCDDCDWDCRPSMCGKKEYACVVYDEDCEDCQTFFKLCNTFACQSFIKKGICNKCNNTMNELTH